MKLTIDPLNSKVAVLRVDGKKFCYIAGYDVLSPDVQYSVVLRSTMGDIAPFIVGVGIEITDIEGHGLQVGRIAGDDFVIEGRATLAKLINEIRDAIDSMETITLEIA